MSIKHVHSTLRDYVEKEIFGLLQSIVMSDTMQRLLKFLRSDAFRMVNVNITVS